MLRNSKISISKPNEASIRSRTRSATFAMSIMEFISLLHSINVMRRFFPIKKIIMVQEVSLQLVDCRYTGNDCNGSLNGSDVLSGKILH